MAWAKLSSDTLSSTADIITNTWVAAKKFNVFLFDRLNSGNADGELQFNNNTGSNYARRYSYNGGADSTQTSQTKINIYLNDSTPNFLIHYMINISDQEKLILGFGVEQNTAGAGTAPNRVENVGKWANTSSQVTEIDVNNSGVGSFNTDTNLTTLGTD